MTQRFVTTSPDGSRDALYERRSAMSRDLLGDQSTEQFGGKPRKRRSIGVKRDKTTTRPQRVRPPELVLGIVLVVGGAFATTTLAGSRSEMVRVVAASRPIARGQAFLPDDLKSISIERSLAQSFVSATEAKNLVGKVTALSISAGSPIVAGMFVEIPLLQENEAIVPVRLERGDAPQDISPGDNVRVAFVPDASLSTATEAQDFGSTATVWNVQEPSDEAPDFVVSLKGPRELLIALVAAQRVKISIVSRSTEQPS